MLFVSIGSIFLFCAVSTYALYRSIGQSSCVTEARVYTQLLYQRDPENTHNACNFLKLCAGGSACCGISWPGMSRQRAWCVLNLWWGLDTVQPPLPLHPPVRGACSFLHHCLPLLTGVLRMPRRVNSTFCRLCVSHKHGGHATTPRRPAEMSPM